MVNPLHDALLAPLAGRDSPLLQMPDGARISGADFLSLVARLANVLETSGLRAGDRLAVQVEKSPEALAVYGAAIMLGAVFLPLNPAYTAAEVGYFLNDATPRIFICDPAHKDELAGVAGTCGARILTLGADGRGSLTDENQNRVDAIKAAPRAPGDLAAILYTSGTTGRSKGAMLTHENLLSNAVALANLWRFTPDDVLLHALPIYHTHGLFVATNVVLLTGGAMQFLPGFDLDTIRRVMPQASVMMGVPTFYTRLLADPRFTRETAAGMRLFISGSAPLLAATHREFRDRTGHAILERYGLTETGMNTSNPYEGERRAGTVGLPLPGVALRIMEGAREVGPGEAGVIEVRGPNVFAGYWRMPEKTREELRDDGWFITGDIGTRDTDGYVTIVGREKDMIISGGLNVYPREVELLLDAQPGVAESAVIGLPHPDFGEAVFAVLVRTPGADPDPDEALAAIAPHIARFKQPKGAVVVDALPRNAMGKVQKALLRAEHAGRFARAANAGG